jgi:transcriptional regulator with XRE-family HTH domain
MSQAQLAAAAETTMRTIGSVERGDSIPQPETLRRILDALGIDTESRPKDDDRELDTLMAALRPMLAMLDDFRRAKAMPKLIEILTAEVRTQAFEELLMMGDDELVERTEKAPQPEG